MVHGIFHPGCSRVVCCRLRKVHCYWHQKLRARLPEASFVTGTRSFVVTGTRSFLLLLIGLHQKLRSVLSRTEASTQCAQHPLLHPPDTPTQHPSTLWLGHTHPISTVTGHRALLSTTLSLRRISPTTAFQAMTLTVVVGPAAGCNCGLAARPLLHSRVRSLGDRPHTLCQRRCLTEACEGTGLLLRPPI